MAFRLSNASKDAMINALGPLANSGTCKIYTGTQPATPDTAASGTLLVSIPFGATAFTTASGGSGNIGLSGGTAISASVSTSGTAGYARVWKSDGTTALFDVDITISGGGGSMTFDNITFVSGGTATINTMSISVPM